MTLNMVFRLKVSNLENVAQIFAQFAVEVEAQMRPSALDVAAHER